MKIFTGSNGKPQAVPQAAIIQAVPDSAPAIIPVEDKAQPWINPFKTDAPAAEEPSSEVSLDDILEDSETNIKLAHAHNNAVNLLHNSIDMLATKLDNVKADKLPSVIAAASKTIESIRRERSEASKNNKGRDVHYHFYTPVQKKLSDYEVIEVEGMLEPGVETSSDSSA
jgi:hypothetical protein